MGAIGKIREKSLLLIIIIGLAMGAFILSDFIKTCDRTSGEQIVLGEIYGEPIDQQKYDQILQDEMKASRDRMTQEGKTMTEQDVETAKDKAWNEYIRQTIMEREFLALGIEVDVNELNDFIHGENIHPQIKQFPFFQNQQGQFVRDSLVNFVNNYLPNAQPEDLAFWKNIEDFVKGDRKVKKYLTLVQHGVYTTSAEANAHYQEKNSIKQVRFVVKKYASIPNTEIDSVTDSDIRAFYDEHKEEKRYEMKETRMLKYIEFPINPSQSDIAAFSSKLEKLKTRFTKLPNDTMQVANFVNNSGSTITFDPNKKYKSTEYPQSIDSLIINAKIGDVIGPVQWSNGNMALVKVFDNSTTEEQATVRHILLNKESAPDMASLKKRADSLVRVINTNNNFEDMVVAMSDDPGSKSTGGVYEWFPKGQMVPPFEKASFEGEFNKLQVVETQYGLHIVEPLKRRTVPTPVLAVVDKEIAASRTTIDSIKLMVSNLTYDNEGATLAEIAEKSNTTVRDARVAIDNYNLPQFDKVSGLKKWAFSGITSEGNLSEPIETGNKIVLAQLESKIEKGVPDFEDVKEMMRGEATKHKKAMKYIEIMDKNAGNLNAIASSVNEQILNADLKFSSNTIAGGGGNEPELIGKIFAIQDNGVMTKAIEGETGVYVIEIVSTTAAPETSDLSVQQQELTQQRRAQVDAGVFNALLKKADVQDNRRIIDYDMK